MYKLIKINFNGLKNGGSVEFLEESYNSIVNTIKNLISDGYKYNDILLICHNKKVCYEITDLLPCNIKNNTVFVKDSSERELKTKLLTSTYHSSKGLEGKVVILADVDRFI